MRIFKLEFALLLAAFIFIPSQTYAASKCYDAPFTLENGQSITTDDGSTRLVAQADGVVVLYDKTAEAGSNVLWRMTGTELVLSDGGNVSVLRSNGKTKWSSETASPYPTEFCVETGNISVYDKMTKNPLWQAYPVTHREAFETKLSTGDGSTCYVDDAGKAYCWGKRFQSTLESSTQSKITPTEIPELFNSYEASTGFRNLCDVDSSGRVACWSNKVKETKLFNARFLSNSTYHTCAITESYHVACWGDNTWGELGNGTTIDQTSPVLVESLSNVASVSTGTGGTCAVTFDGDIYCWGNNYFGQLGNLDSDISTTPVALRTSGDVSKVSVGEGHTCFLKKDGHVMCLGLNDKQELGNGNSTNSVVPVEVSNLSDVATISAGNFHTCALKNDGTVWCWGFNYRGN